MIFFLLAGLAVFSFFTILIVRMMRLEDHWPVLNSILLIPAYVIVALAALVIILVVVVRFFNGITALFN